MMPAEQYTYISSRLIKEVFSLGGRIHGLVPDMVEERLRAEGRAADEPTMTTSRSHVAHLQLAHDDGDDDGRSAAARRGRRD